MLPICQKTTNLVEDVGYLIPVKFRQIAFVGCKGKVENVSIRGQGGHLFLGQPQNINLVEDVEYSLPIKVLSNSVKRFLGRSKSKI